MVSFVSGRSHSYSQHREAHERALKIKFGCELANSKERARGLPHRLFSTSVRYVKVKSIWHDMNDQTSGLLFSSRSQIPNVHGSLQAFIKQQGTALWSAAVREAGQVTNNGWVTYLKRNTGPKN